jgi:hypothetical protein
VKRHQSRVISETSLVKLHQSNVPSDGTYVSHVDFSAQRLEFLTEFFAEFFINAAQ